MKPLKATDFPELRRVFAGYLHEDFLEEHGTPAAALRAFRADADASEGRRFRLEVVRFLTHIEGASLSEVRELLASLGSRWVPPSRKALLAVFAEIASAHEN